MTDVVDSRRSDRVFSTVSGKFVLLGSDALGDDGSVRYPGRFGIKYGPNKSDWLRMSYIELVSLVNFILENRDFVNEQVERERIRLGSEVL